MTTTGQLHRLLEGRPASLPVESRWRVAIPPLDVHIPGTAHNRSQFSCLQRAVTESRYGSSLTDSQKVKAEGIVNIQSVKDLK